MHLRRSLLYVPGDDAHKALKASNTGADCICLDLEDGVATTHKEIARKVVVESLRTIDFQGSEKMVRINGLTSGLAEEDLNVILTGNPDSIYLPKVSRTDDVVWIQDRLDQFERSQGMIRGSIDLLLGIESTLAILNLDRIGQAFTRVSALVFGGEDYLTDLGGVKTPTRQELLFPRSKVAIYAAAYGLQAIDIVCTDYKNEELLKEETRSGVSLGYTGKQVIHPLQVAPVQAAFTPDPEVIDQARRIVRAYQENLSAGRGAFSLDGKMIDMPIVKAAERILSRSNDLEAMPANPTDL